MLHAAETPPGHCLDKRFIEGIRLLGKLGLSFDLCMRAAELGDAAKLIDACPDTSFILDHCGNASVRTKDLSGWKADIGRIAERKNVVCKVSGIVASAAPGPWTANDLAPIVNHVLDQFGPDRVVFGGDWPVCTLAATYRQWVEALRQIVADRPQPSRRNCSTTMRSGSIDFPDVRPTQQRSVRGRLGIGFLRDTKNGKLGLTPTLILID